MPALRNPEIRDLEILRALVRVRYLTSRQLINTFFSCPRVGRRRVHRLSEYDLIRPHTKGLSERLKYTAWRITARGLDQVAHALPDEPIPDGLLDRVANGSLHHVHHREALAELYLNLVVPDRSRLAEADRAAHRRWAAEMRGRAASLGWQPDGDVVLTADYLGQRTDVVPDAVVRSGRSKLRVLVELDRSTKDLGRIRDGLERYARVLPHVDLGGDAPILLFVVRSAMRKANMTELARTVFGLPKTLVLENLEAVEWLREELLSLSPEPRSLDNVLAAAKRAYRWMHGFLGPVPAVDGQEPEVMAAGRVHLVALYQALKAREGADR